MSFRLVDWAAGLPLDSAHDKLVLMMLARHVNSEDPTHSCFPSVACLARETAMSDKGVRLALARLVELRLVRVSGNCRHRHYHLQPGVEIPVSRAAIAPTDPVPGAAIEAAIPVPPTTNAVRRTSDCGTPYRPIGKGSETNREGEEPPPPPGNADGMKAKTLGKQDGGTPSHASRLSPDWQPSAADIAFAEREHGALDWRRQARLFRDYWCAKPGPQGLRLDWSATWRRWLDKAWPEERGRGGMAGGARSSADRGGAAPMPAPLRSEPWEQRLKDFAERGTWYSHWGDKPGSDGCRVPREVLERWGYERSAALAVPLPA